MAEDSTNTSNEVNTSNLDTGVSNGDVDWLFRGKSKKLTKRMSTTGDKKVNQPDNSRSTNIGATGESVSSTCKESNVSNKTECFKQDTKLEREGRKDAGENNHPSSNADASIDKEKGGIKTPQKGTPVSTDQQAGSYIDGIQHERISKLDKFKLGRSRSSSTSSVSSQHLDNGITPTTPIVSRRKGSLSFITNSNPKTLTNEADMQREVQNSGSKRSIFSSFSSKFKSGNSPNISSTSPSSSAIPSTNSSIPIKAASDNFESVSPISVPITSRRRSSIVSKFSLSPKDSEKDWFTRRSSVLSQDNSLRDKNNKEVQSSKLCREKVERRNLNAIKLKRVLFAVDKLPSDPQQQIPSRRPKKGNVLIPEEMMSPSPRLSQGISLNDGNGGKIPSSSDVKYSDKELQIAIQQQTRSRIESEKHANEAHLSAKRIAHEVSHYKTRLSSKISEATENMTSNDDDEGNACNSDFAHEVGNIEIDKPLHLHEKHFEDLLALDSDDLSLETIYTRCCHLREILPIPATLKQLKNKTAPLQVLKLLNPKPTLVDALSFSDFIGITPINTIIFDNVFMTTEMFKHFLASLVGNKSLEKLSLRNVPIDSVGWCYLCKFLSTNKTVKKLDISQQRIKPDTKSSCIRSNMNWDLFIEAIVTRGGIEELVINGCKLSDSTFKSLVDNAVKLSTFRFGIASIELNTFKAKVVADWISDPKSKCVGVDIAFNDLTNGQLIPFIDAFRRGTLKLIFFSLNSTYLKDTQEVSELLEALTYVRTLRFLDLSSLPDLFPGIISKLSECLPRYSSLKRIHFDLCELSNQAINAIADILPKIEGLLYVSFLGNRNLNNNSAGILYTAVKLSGSIISLDLDYDLVSDTLSQRIAFYLMRNMDKTVNSEIASNDNEEDLIFDGSLLMESAEKFLIKNEEGKEEDANIQKLINNALIERTRAVRRELHKSIDKFFEKRNNGTLSLEEKETLLRFCLLDASLEKMVYLFEENEKSQGSSEEKHSSSQLQVQLPHIDLSNMHDMHESSKELLTSGPILSPHNTFHNSQGYFPQADPSFQPHQVVIDSSSDGTKVPIDNFTGRPVLMRSISHTSVHAKEQEQEEGEFHRWGFFIEQRNNDTTQSEGKDKESKDIPALNVLPSGSELRDAIIEAKGIESITDLIGKINNNRVSIDNIYTLAENENISSLKEKPVTDNLKHDKENTMKNEPIKLSQVTSPSHDGDNYSFDSENDSDGVRDTSNQEVNAVVDEVYDKLLNDAQRVRSNK